ncbi:zinc finger and BTB domain-containing protein 39 [Callorhinchus milii]|uniref:Zinc finger and BTB domain containing 39 n=1 Tax=Callorhinchus milii TaxID=7868 RepID=A0A4W3IXB3_CALMI|nr:zinc finger and BTB domain-containing protein 39 [Callorhinchus milii]|eukprot:gi/632982559/ref/XP_007908202.1/ PREDICTED: zinc finger and BTB domain-containing protein 39 [Callorhinchus milii]
MGMRIKLHSADHPNNLLKELNKFRLSETMCDVIIVVGNRTFSAHKSVLACAAGYFQKLFLHSEVNTTRTYVVDFITPANFERILNFIYTAELFTDLINVGVIYEVAEKLGMQDLLKACYSTFPDLEKTESSRHPQGLGRGYGASEEQNPAGPDSRNSGSQLCENRGYIMQVEVGDSYKSEDRSVGSENGPSLSVMYQQPTKTEEDNLEMEYSQATSTESIALPTSKGPCELYEIQSNGYYNQTSLLLPGEGLKESGSPCVSNSADLQAQAAKEMECLPFEGMDHETLQFEEQQESRSGEVIELTDDSEDEDLVCVKDGEGEGESKALPCQVCGKLLPANMGLIRQHGKLHIDMKAGVCRVCGGKFTDRSSRITHVLSHVGIFLFACDMCEMKFVTQWQVAGHRKAKPYDTNIIIQPNTILPAEASFGASPTELFCAVCGKATAREFLAVKEHVLSHLDMKSLSCCVCEQPSRSVCSLMWHVLSHMNISIFSCSVCGDSFVDQGLLEQHMSSHQGLESYLFECNFCSRKFRLEASFQNHMKIHKKHHAEGVKDLLGGGGGQQHQWLKKTLIMSPSQESTSDCHLPGLHHELLQVNHGKASAKGNWYECEFCRKRFSHSSEFQYHLRIHSGEKPYECKLCHKFFRGRSTVKNHLKTHSGALMYCCTVCHKYCPTLNLMIKHVEAHKDGGLPPDFNIAQTFMYIVHSKQPVKMME